MLNTPIDPKLIASRLKVARKELNMTQAEFSKQAGISQSNLSEYENGKVVPELSTLNMICLKVGINTKWFESGIGEMVKRKARAGSAANTIKGNARPLGVDIPEAYIQLPFVSYKAWATFTDTFSDFNPKEVQETYPVFAAKLPPAKGNENRMVFEILGDSMEERLYERDIILTTLVDEGDFEYLNSGIYVVAYRNQLVIKRVIDNDLQRDGTLTLHSDNVKRGKVVVQRHDLRYIWKFLAVIYSTHQ